MFQWELEDTRDWTKQLLQQHTCVIYENNNAIHLDDFSKCIKHVNSRDRSYLTIWSFFYSIFFTYAQPQYLRSWSINSRIKTMFHVYSYASCCKFVTLKLNVNLFPLPAKITVSTNLSVAFVKTCGQCRYIYRHCFDTVRFYRSVLCALQGGSERERTFEDQVSKQSEPEGFSLGSHFCPPGQQVVHIHLKQWPTDLY